MCIGFSISLPLKSQDFSACNCGHRRIRASTRERIKSLPNRFNGFDAFLLEISQGLAKKVADDVQ